MNILNFLYWRIRGLDSDSQLLLSIYRTTIALKHLGLNSSYIEINIQKRIHPHFSSPETKPVLQALVRIFYKIEPQEKDVIEELKRITKVRRK